MKQHYNLNDVEWNKLVGEVTTMELLKAIPEFDPHGSELPITKVSLLHYLDKHGDFSEGGEPHRKIAKAVFASLDNKDKVEVMKYMQWLDDEGDSDNSDD